MLETQIAQQASLSSTPQGRLPSKPEQNPREQCNVIVLRSGKELESPKGNGGVENEKDKSKGALPHESESEKEVEKEKEKETKPIPPKPYMPPLPFP